MKRLVAVAVLVLAAAVVVSSASAGKPVINRVDIDETSPDGFLTAACGVPVMSHVKGHIITRTFSGSGAGPAEITTLNLGITASAGDNTYRFRDVGADHVQIERDGTEILMIIGQIPFGFTGVLKINPTTGEVVHEPGHDISGRLEEACAALTT